MGSCYDKKGSMTSNSTTRSIILCLFRNDLRLRDNPTLFHGNKHPKVSHLLPIYCFDPRQVDLTNVKDKAYTAPKSGVFGLPKCSKLRTKFLMESVLNLKNNLKKLGSELLVAYEPPEEFLPRLTKEILTEYNIEGVYLQEEVTDEEIKVQETLVKNLDVPVKFFNGATLVHPEDLPFTINELPDVYTQFRKKVESLEPLFREVLPSPKELKPFPESEKLTSMMTLNNAELFQQLALGNDVVIDERSAFPFCGGEDEGIKRLHDWIWNSRNLSTYKETRNGLIGTEYSSKISPWLAHGCVSPREVMREVGKYEEKYEANTSTYWIQFELLWRDYFWLVGRKYGNGLFYRDGLLSQINHKQPGNQSWKVDKRMMTAWTLGKTGIPWVDANMRELIKTG
ncbi:hypothetical protein K7432_014477 [Basidiobolus ranarum]